MKTLDVKIINSDCLVALREMEPESVDSVVCDPPYGLSNTKPSQVADVLAAWVTGDTEAVPAKKGGFMGKDWDSFVPPPAVWAECLRVLKPGGHMAVFAGARTQDLMGLSIRLAGFEIRDTLGWVYGSGFPKSMDVSKAIDKAVGAEMEKVRTRITPNTTAGKGFSNEQDERPWMTAARRRGFHEHDSSTPASDEAQRWDGWGTALKPAIEPIILARKPLDGTVANNVLAHGVGGLNIDACRVGMSDADREAAKVPQPVQHNDGRAVYQMGTGEGRNGATFEPAPAGRFPANVLLDEHAAKEMDEQSGWQKDGTAVRRNRKNSEANPNGIYSSHVREAEPDQTFGSGGGASRFFPVFKYQAKAPKRERPVIYLNECECNEWQSPEKATTESTSTGGRSWNTSTSGSGSTGQYQTDTTSITSTMTSSTIESKTYDASPELSTSASIQAANCETESGGNRAECADHSSPSVMGTGTSVKKAGRSTDGAAPVTSRKWFTTSECESCGAPRRKVTHCTVKPVALMEWLVTLITPEGGTTLDPFAGTGTTLQAARGKGFNAIGVEQDAEYIALIEQRLGGVE